MAPELEPGDLLDHEEWNATHRPFMDELLHSPFSAYSTMQESGRIYFELEQEDGRA